MRTATPKGGRSEPGPTTDSWQEPIVGAGGDGAQAQLRPGSLLALDDTAKPNLIVVAYEDAGLWAQPYVGGLALYHDSGKGWFVRQPTAEGRKPRFLSDATVHRARQLVKGPPPLDLPLAPWLADLLRVPPPPPPVRDVSRSGLAYTKAALEGEVSKVAKAPHGLRNVTLNGAAYALGRLIGPDGLDLDRVWWALARAAQASGLPDRETEATMTSGLRAGMQRPRRLP